jgi:hypothetical protein
VIRFTRDGRYVPFDVLSTGEEGTRIPGDRVSVRCAWCGKPVTLPTSMSLDEVVNLLEAKKRFRHPSCKGGKDPAERNDVSDAI